MIRKNGVPSTLYKFVNWIGFWCSLTIYVCGNILNKYFRRFISLGYLRDTTFDILASNTSKMTRPWQLNHEIAHAHGCWLPKLSLATWWHRHFSISSLQFSISYILPSLLPRGVHVYTWAFHEEFNTMKFGVLWTGGLEQRQRPCELVGCYFCHLLL